jgi:hypothetical protein
MAKKKRSNPDEELEWRQKIKKLVIIAMFSDNLFARSDREGSSGYLPAGGISGF